MFVQQLIQQFVSDTNEIEKLKKEEEEQLEKLRQIFVNKFTPERIATLTKEEYVQGFGDKTTFCYQIENTLQGLGDIHGSIAKKFALYFSEKNKKYITTKRFGVTEDECMENIKKELLNLINIGQSGDYQKICKSKFAPLFRGKILATYYPDKYLNIFSDNHLKNFLKILNIPFKEKEDVIYKQNKLLEWKKSQPKLKDLSPYLFMKFIYSLNKYPNFIEKYEDDKLVEDLQSEILSNMPTNFQYINQALPKEKPVFNQGKKKIYPRDRIKSKNALAYAHFKCEIDEQHPTFIRRNSDKPYTEPHHLIPMAYQDEFDNSLDREQNIVSLCSNCHNEIHYGKHADKLIEQLFRKREKLLKEIGIKIDKRKLLDMYKIDEKNS